MLLGFYVSSICMPVLYLGWKQMCHAPQVGMASCYNVSRNSIITIISIIITQLYYISFPTEATLEKELVSLLQQLQNGFASICPQEKHESFRDTRGGYE